MKYLSILILLLAFIIPSKAQISSYDIATFQEPNRKQKQGGLTFDGRFRNENSNNFSGRVTNSFNTNLGWFDNRFTDIDNIESSMNTGLNFTINGGKEKNENSSYLNTTIFAYNSSEKRWFNESLKFFGMGVDFSGRLNNNRSRFNGVSDVTAVNNSLGLRIPISIGKGQPQNTSDAWHAITILEFLNAQGLLSKAAFSDEEIIGFANELSLIRNVRNTDFRLERISEIEQLINYITENNMVNDLDYRLFAHVHDAWIFENFEPRESGKRFSLGIAPTLNINQSINSTDFNSIVIPVGADLFVGYDVYKPLSLDWQLDFESEFAIGPRQTIYGGDLEIVGNDPYLRTSLGASVGIGHFFSRRTFWELDLRPQIVNLNYSSQLSPFNTNTTVFNTWLTGQYVYYFSPQLSMNVFGSVNLNTQSNELGENPLFNGNEIRVSTNYRFY